MFYRIFLGEQLLESLSVYVDLSKYGVNAVARPIPRVGEQIYLDEKLYCVKQVTYDLDTNDVVIEVVEIEHKPNN